jgi:hypothetical protein
MTDATEERSWQRRFLECSAAAGAAAPPMRGTPTRTSGWWQRPVIWPNWFAVFSKNEWHVRPIDADYTTDHHFDLADDQVLVPLQSDTTAVCSHASSNHRFRESSVESAGDRTATPPVLPRLAHLARNLARQRYRGCDRHCQFFGDYACGT